MAQERRERTESGAAKEEQKQRYRKVVDTAERIAGHDRFGTAFSDYLSFRLMITPGIIKPLYLVGAVAAAALPLLMVFAAFTDAPFNWLLFVSGILALVLGNVVWRIFCEAVSVLFDVRDKASKTKPDAACKDSAR